MESKQKLINGLPALPPFNIEYNPLPIEKIREIEKAMLSENRYFKGRTIRESIKLEGKI